MKEKSSYLPVLRPVAVHPRRLWCHAEGDPSRKKGCGEQGILRQAYSNTKIQSPTDAHSRKRTRRGHKLARLHTHTYTHTSTQLLLPPQPQPPNFPLKMSYTWNFDSKIERSTQHRNSPDFRIFLKKMYYRDFTETLFSQNLDNVTSDASSLPFQGDSSHAQGIYRQGRNKRLLPRSNWKKITTNHLCAEFEFESQ